MPAAVALVLWPYPTFSVYMSAALVIRAASTRISLAISLLKCPALLLASSTAHTLDLLPILQGHAQVHYFTCSLVTSCRSVHSLPPATSTWMCWAA